MPVSLSEKNYMLSLKSVQSFAVKKGFKCVANDTEQGVKEKRWKAYMYILARIKMGIMNIVQQT